MLIIAIVLLNPYMAAEIARRKKVEQPLAQSKSLLCRKNHKLEEMRTLRETGAAR